MEQADHLGVKPDGQSVTSDKQKTLLQNKISTTHSAMVKYRG